MAVIDVVTDIDNLSLSVVAHFDAPVERVWRIWSDPRQLERWWGPPGYPATISEYDLRPGGTVDYFMTGPDSQRYHGWWRVLEVEPPRRLRFEDGFGEGGQTPDGMPEPTTSTVTLTALGPDRTEMVLLSSFRTRESMLQTLDMGVEEGLRAALGQVDDLLREPQAVVGE